MITPNEVQTGCIYRHQNKSYVRLIEVRDTTVIVEQYGDRLELDKEHFTKFYTPIYVTPLED